MIAPFLSQRFERLAPKFWISASIALLFNMGGILAFLLWGKSLLSSLSALNLLVMGILVFINHERISKKFVIIFLSILLIGFTAEIIGVNTGIIFGDYQYSDVLGIAIFGVPLIIGLNWAVVVLGAHALAQLIVSSKFWPAVLKKTWLSLILAAGLATLFDYLLEPVAIYLNFWQWEAGVIPMLNYISWFGVSLVALLLVERFNTGENKMAAIVLLAQTIFLVGITLLFR